MSPNCASISGSVIKGSTVYLDIATEGLNGYKTLAVEIYNTKDEKTPLTTIQSQKVVDGSTFLELKTNTLQILEILESFYVKIKNPNTGHYVHDGNKNEKLASFLQVSNAFVLPSFLAPTSIVPSKVGQINVNYSKIEPCQYTEIKLINDKGEVTEIYKEDNKKQTNPFINKGVIVGSHKKKFIITVDKKSNVAQCFLSGNNKHKQLIIGSAPLNATIINNTPTKIDFEASFDYGNTVDILKNYFILTNNFTQSVKFNKIKFKAITCRHKNDINITILPDIEWELAFVIATGPGLRLKSDKMTYKKIQGDLGQYQFKGIKLEDIGNIIEKGSLGYSLVLKYSINSGNYVNQISFEFIKNIERIIDTYNGVAKFLEFFKGKDDNGYSAALETGSINKITFDLDPPSIVFLLKWKYNYAKMNNEAILCYTGAAGFKPLIGAKISVDLLQNLDKFGGLVGLVLNWLVKIIKKIAKADLYIIVEVASKLDFDIGLSYNEIDGFDPNTNQTVTAELSFSIKAGIKKKDVIFVATTNRIQGNTIDMDKTEQESFKVEGVVSTGIVYKQENGYDKNKGKFTKTEIKWTGAEMTITVILINNNRRVNAPPNYKEKFTILERETIYGPETTYQK